MNTDITVSDGTTSRTYKSAFGGPYRKKDGKTVEHLRKTAEFDNTPETLITRFTQDGNYNHSNLTLEKVKVVETTGRRSVMRTTVTHHVEPGVFTQAESDNQLAEMTTIVSTNKTDVSQGNM